MNTLRERNAIPDGIWATGCDRLDMRSVDLGSTKVVGYTKPRQCTATGVGLLHDPIAEGCITDRQVGHNLPYLSLWRVHQRSEIGKTNSRQVRRWNGEQTGGYRDVPGLR